MNPTLGLVERDLNAENKLKGKRRAVMSMGGKPVDDTLSPKSLARRTAVRLFSLPRSTIPILLLSWTVANHQVNEGSGLTIETT